MSPLVCKSRVGWMAAAVIGAGLLASHAHAADVLQFSDFRITAQSGGHFALEPSRMQTLTLEQSTGWNFGDVYWFVDQSWYRNGPDYSGHQSSWYGEFSPRLSFAKLSGKAPGTGLIRDVLVAATLEQGRDERATSAQLIGLGVDFNLPGMDYANANLYARKQVHEGDFDTWQLTLAGARHFNIGGQRFLLDGFVDYVAPGGSRHWNLHVSPQLKWDLGASHGAPDRWYAGVELHYWKHKFGVAPIPGVKTTDETVGVIVQRRF